MTKGAELQARYRRDPVEGPKYRIRMATKEAIRKGLLLPQPCEVCGAQNVEAHHDDYEKPLAVRWLCRSHHAEIHWKTHCPKGHPLTGANLSVRLNKDGHQQRECIICRRDKNMLANHKKRGIPTQRKRPRLPQPGATP